MRGTTQPNIRKRERKKKKVKIDFHESNRIATPPPLAHTCIYIRALILLTLKKNGKEK